MTLDFDLSDPKSNQFIFTPMCTFNINLVKFNSFTVELSQVHEADGNMQILLRSYCVKLVLDT